MPNLQLSRRAAVVLLLICMLWPKAAPATFLFAPTPPPPPAWDYPVSREALADEADVLRLIGRDNLLEREYPDETIAMYKMTPVTAPTCDNGLTLRPVANDALAAMLEAAKAADIKLYAGSAWRSYRTQEVIHYNRVRDRGYDDGTNQPAGASEHQSGLAVDVVSWAYRDGYKTSFGKTDEGLWLREHCADYGFILRYPEDKTDITQVSYEPWHMRYVGVEAAQYITRSGLTLEEFTAEWQLYLAAWEAAQP